MCVHGNLIAALVVVLFTTVTFALTVSPSGVVKVEQQPNSSNTTETAIFQRQRTALEYEDVSEDVHHSRPKRRTRDSDEKNNIESSISLWEWLKGRDKPEDNCMLLAIGGVASGGALTGAFVGAGIGSIFTGPGAIVGGIIGGLVGVFGGLSVGTRAGMVACENA